MIPTADQLFSFVRSLNGAPQETNVRRKPFFIGVADSSLSITPNSSKQARMESKETVKKLLQQLERTNSYRVADYQDLTFNASYILAVVKAWQKHQGH